MYYLARPLIPRIIRIQLRRRHARKIAQSCTGSWPIQESAKARPKGWPGWPEENRFALVLTHDVEGREGLKKIKPLAELELKLGFRSAFNLVPEGEYSVTKEIRAYLKQNGFEIGVHDLHHDGKLYSSRKEFLSKATRINHYLKEWNASGFRSAFMLHNLDWIKNLEVSYDSSTFDVDPFEPQPDGVGTIFPFWVPRGDLENGSSCASLKVLNRGYLELPYTLPQDSTLFLFLQEQTNQIWKTKLDWIAENGGMALLNVHPDYINFGNARDPFRYPAALYADFLEYIKNRYRGQYWHALPKKMADFCTAQTALSAPPARRQRNICLLAATNYKTDARVSRYAQSLVRRGDRVEVIACSPNDLAPETLYNNGVIIQNIVPAREDLKKGPISHLILLLKFFIKSFAHITKSHRVRPYDVIHVHNIPEWLVFAALVPKLTGTKILLDIHDLVPELFLAKFKKGERSVLGPILKLVERISCHFADHVIVSNHLWRYKLLERSVSKNKCSVFINNIDLNIFYPRKRTRLDQRKIVLFHGSLQWHQGMDIAIRAFPRVVDKVPSAEMHIYGCGGEKPALMELSKSLGLEKKVLFLPLVPVEEVPQILANADLGVVPKRVDSFGNQAYSTKIMEFMSQGVPVVISRTAIDSYYFDNDVVRFCESGDVEGFASAMTELLTDQSLRDDMIQKALHYVSLNHWGIKEQEYLSLIDRLATNSEKNSSVSVHPDSDDFSVQPDISAECERADGQASSNRVI